MFQCYPAEFLCYLLVLVTLHTGDTVRIRELRVPALARHGTSVVLDCDYTLDDEAGDHEGLVVKWYLNDDTRPVYQWIAGGNGQRPQGLGILRDRLNLAYRASQDARTWHRALHIPAPAADMSGEYTCVVSSFSGEDKQSKRMLVFVPERSLRLQQRMSSDGESDVVCTAEGVFPQPEMSIRAAHGNTSSELEGAAVLHRQPDGLFDISLAAELPEDARNIPLDLACELSIPSANYTVHKELVYYPGGNASSNDPAYTWMVLTVYGIVKYILKF